MKKNCLLLLISLANTALYALVLGVSKLDANENGIQFNMMGV